MYCQVKKYIEDSRKIELAHAMQTRILTEEEFQEVLEQGKDLFILTMQPYNPKEKQEEFNAAVLQQYKIRHIVQSPNK
jgi:hypothetical protein